MFEKIEREFIERSKYYKNSKKIITMITILLIVSYLIILKFFSVKNFKTIIISLVLIFIITFILFYLYIILKLQKEKKIKFSIETLFKYSKTIDSYKDYVYEEDMITLGLIFLENNINNAENLIEIIRHYQNVMPKNNYSSYNLTSFISLIIAIVALICTNTVFNNIENLYMIAIILLVSVVLYVGFTKIKEYMNLAFGDFELYNKIEKAAIELYINKLVN